LTPLTDSCTSIYQLLPTYPCIDSGASGLKRTTEVALPRLNAQRATDAATFHGEIADALASNSRDQAYVTNAYNIVPIVGFAQRTLQSALIRQSQVTFSEALGSDILDGDGTVPRPSATPLELSGKNRELYVSEVHTSLQAARAVLDQVRGLLSGSALNWDSFRGGEQSLSIVIPTLLASTERLLITGRYAGAAGKPRVSLQVQDAYSGQTIAQSRPIHAADGGYSAELFALSPGAYRVVVELNDVGGLETRTVSDVCVVLDSAK
jgi:hypothetical protein